MGDRLVTVIRHKGKFYAASYQHWSAEAAEEVEALVDDEMLKCDFNNFPTQEKAFNVLKNALDKWNGDNVAGLVVQANSYKWDGNNDRYITTPIDCVEGKKYLKSHPDVVLATNRSEGLITLDEAVGDDYLGWAEAVNNFDWEDEDDSPKSDRAAEPAEA